jgi:CRISPR-associated endonuclease/helicase Cas3
MKYYAHSENDSNEKHTLSKHLLQTADLASSFTCQEKYQHIFYMTGLLHDLGKYQSEFQNYLENGGRRGSVPHASWGAGYARCNELLEASIAIDGHHKGLPDNAKWKSDTEPFKRQDVIGFEDIVKAFKDDVDVDDKFFRQLKLPEFSQPLQREAFIRYLFSAVTDSDWLSTEEHFDREASKARVCATLPINEMTNKLDEEFSKKSKEGEINRLRNDARNQVLEKAAMTPDVNSGHEVFSCRYIPFIELPLVLSGR